MMCFFDVLTSLREPGCAPADKKSPQARKVSLIPRPCEALYPAGIFSLTYLAVYVLK